MVPLDTSVDSAVPPPGSVKGRQTQEKILRVATRLFAEQGYDGTGIRDIEHAAEVNRGVVTYHFGNKEDIWKAAFRFSFMPYLADLRSKIGLLRALDPRARMHFLIERLIRTSAESPHLNQLMIRENAAPSWRTNWIIENFLLPLRQISNEIAAGDPLQTALESDPHLRYVLLGACNMVFSLPGEVKALYGQDVTDEAFVQRHVAVVIGMIECLLAQSAPSREKANV